MDSDHFHLVSSSLQASIISVVLFPFFGGFCISLTFATINIRHNPRWRDRVYENMRMVVEGITSTTVIRKT